jgi:hypothetical protein
MTLSSERGVRRRRQADNGAPIGVRMPIPTTYLKSMMSTNMLTRVHFLE